MVGSGRPLHEYVCIHIESPEPIDAEQQNSCPTSSYSNGTQNADRGSRHHESVLTVLSFCCKCRKMLHSLQQTVLQNVPVEGLQVV
jgi:hypothetical protein